MRYSTDIVVIDLETTCPTENQGNNSVECSSSIEVGAVWLDRRRLEITDTFGEVGGRFLEWYGSSEAGKITTLDFRI